MDDCFIKFILSSWVFYDIMATRSNLLAAVASYNPIQLERSTLWLYGCTVIAFLVVFKAVMMIEKSRSSRSVLNLLKTREEKTGFCTK